MGVRNFFLHLYFYYQNCSGIKIKNLLLPYHRTLFSPPSLEKCNRILRYVTFGLKQNSSMRTMFIAVKKGNKH